MKAHQTAPASATRTASHTERGHALDAPAPAARTHRAAEGARTDLPVHDFSRMSVGKRSTTAFRPAPERKDAGAMANNTGLPDRLKAGVENLSGLPMDDVRVHFNSSKPAALRALAYTQGTDIHVGPGQERHLPHEAWHVAQQKQGRVKPTLQMKGVAINDDSALEREADAMGARADRVQPSDSPHQPIQENNAAGIRGSQPGRSVFQRKIAFKAGVAWANETDIPEEIRRSETIKQLVLSGETYLAQSAADMQKRARGEAAPLLTPHRHLIGERHDESRFDEALASWGWGADKMMEGIMESSNVLDAVSEEIRGHRFIDNIVYNPYQQIKALENLHPFMIATLAALRHWLARVAKFATISASYATLAANEPSVGLHKERFETNESLADLVREKAAGEWEELNAHAASYEDACAEHEKNKALELRPLAEAMKGKWETLDKRKAELTKRPYGFFSFFSSWEEKRDALKAIDGKVEDFTRDIIDPWASALVELTKVEAAKEKLPDADTVDIEEGWAGAKSAVEEGPLNLATSPMRELFMVPRINKLDKPGLVKVGRGHLPGLKGKIADGKPHPSYADFVKDTMTP